MKKLSFLSAALLVCAMAFTSCGGGASTEEKTDSTAVEQTVEPATDVVADTAAMDTAKAE